MADDNSTTVPIFRLYVAGNAPNSARARRNLRALVQHYLSGRAKIEIVDIMQEPERGLADGVLVSPTLVRVTPKPAVRVIGDLSRTERVLYALGLDSRDEEKTDGGRA